MVLTISALLGEVETTESKSTLRLLLYSALDNSTFSNCRSPSIHSASIWYAYHTVSRQADHVVNMADSSSPSAANAGSYDY